jgi:hypothetical protein
MLFARPRRYGRGRNRKSNKGRQARQGPSEISREKDFCQSRTVLKRNHNYRDGSKETTIIADYVVPRRLASWVQYTTLTPSGVSCTVANVSTVSTRSRHSGTCAVVRAWGSEACSSCLTATRRRSSQLERHSYPRIFSIPSSQSSRKTMTCHDRDGVTTSQHSYPFGATSAQTRQTTHNFWTRPYNILH